MVNVRTLLTNDNISITDTSVYINSTTQSLTGTLPSLTTITPGTTIYAILKSNGSNISKVKTTTGEFILFEQTEDPHTTLYPMDTVTRTGVFLALDNTYWVFFPSNILYWIFDDS